MSPSASRDSLVDLEGDVVHVRLTAAPVEGEANRALVKFFARALRIPQREVQIVSGERSRNKTVEVRGLDARSIVVRLSRLNST